MPLKDEEKRREYCRNYNEKHRERIKARKQEAYTINKAATLLRIREYKKANKEKSKRADHARILRLELEDPAKILLSRVKTSSRTRGIPCTITTADLVVPSVCPILGMPLAFRQGRDCVPSVDRIDNTKGYVPGNVWVISGRANTMKNDASIEELRRFCTGVLAAKPLNACV